MTTLWVHAEVTPQGPGASALELLTKARAITEDVASVALGPGAHASADTLAEHGATTVFAGDDQAFADHPGGPAAHALAALAREHAPDLILLAATYEGRDLGGRLQALLGSTLVSNAIDVLGPTRVRTGFAGGTKLVDVDLEGPSPRIVLVRPKSFPAELTAAQADAPRTSTPAVIDVPVPANLPAHMTAARVIERHAESAAGPDLARADVVVAGGRGLGGPDAFAALDELASAIDGAAVGASRAAVDAGWVPYRMQIGQTGVTVTPEVYLAFGISGALQHAVGMKGAKRIVAVNRDRDAPIMRLADLAVVGDLFTILPALTEEVRRRRSS